MICPESSYALSNRLSARSDASEAMPLTCTSVDQTVKNVRTKCQQVYRYGPLSVLPHPQTHFSPSVAQAEVQHDAREQSACSDLSHKSHIGRIARSPSVMPSSCGNKTTSAAGSEKAQQCTYTTNDNQACVVAHECEAHAHQAP